MLRFLKPFSFIPALLMMYVIFSFSAQDGETSAELSYKVSYEIVEVGAKVLGEELQPYEIDSIATRFHGIVRKIAHMTEYFLLAVAVSFPLYVYGLRGILLMLVAGMFCVAFACGDEYHQSYVAGRGPSVRDVAIDSFGVFWGIIFVRIVGWTGRKTIFRPFIKKKKVPEEPQNYSNGNYNQPQNYGNANYYQQQNYNNANYNQQPNYGNSSYNQQPNYGNAGYNQQPNYGNANYGQQTYAQGNRYQQAPYSSPQYVTPPIYSPEGNSEDATSDKLSEDMSLKKLVHDIKEKKKSPDSK
jgi:VanZ family protein